MNCFYRPITVSYQALGLFAAIALASATAQAANRVEIEVVTEPGLSPTAPQEWVRMLSKLDFARVRIRGIRPGDKPDIISTEGATATHFKLLAVLDRGERLILPGARFGRSDMHRLRDYIDRLQKDGAADLGAERGRFGLTKEQFTTVYDDLSQSVNFSTAGKSPVDIMAQIAKQLRLPLEVSDQAKFVLHRAEAVDMQLEDMTAGTALAMLLRREGLALVPQKQRGEPLRLAVIPLKPNQTAWPVGWKPAEVPRVIVPQMYKFLTFEISGYTLAQALDALSPRLGVPLKLDDLILQRRDIHIDKIQVKLPRKKTYLKRAVDRILGQARLAGELRIDEAGKPFYWITQFGKDSPRAE